MKKCDECGTEFTPTKTDIRIRFCSKICADRSYRTAKEITKMCDFPECGNLSRTNGSSYCSGHYSQGLRGEQLRPLLVLNTRNGFCSFEKCDNKIYSLGLCCGHYQQQRAGKELSLLQNQKPKQTREQKNRKARERHAERMIIDPVYAAKQLESSRAQRLADPEKQRDAVRRSAAKMDRSEYNLAWARAHREQRLDAGHRWRAAQRGAEAEVIDRNLVWEEDQGICGICFDKCDPDNWHLDHIIPLSRGGSHTRGNVQVSHPRCNLSKHNKLPEELNARREVRI